MARKTAEEILKYLPSSLRNGDSTSKEIEQFVRTATEQTRTVDPKQGERLSGIDVSQGESQVQSLQELKSGYGGILKSISEHGDNPFNTLFGLVDYGSKARQTGSGFAAATTAAATSFNENLQDRSKGLSDQRFAEQQQILADAEKRRKAIQEETFDTFQKGLFGGRTIDEIVNEEQQQRLAIVSESDRQQRASLIRQQMIQEQQLEMQGKQGALKTTTMLGGRGLAGSSVGEQVLAEQQAQTSEKEQGTVSNLAQGLVGISQGTDKQKAQIQQEEAQRLQQRTQDAMTAWDTKKASEKQKILQDQTTSIQQLTNEYSAKRNEIDKLVDQTNQIIQDIMTGIV